MTAGQMIQIDSGPALLAYLAQPDASPIVCDLRARSPHITRVTADIRRALVDGLVKAKVAPALWRRCVDVLLKGLPPDEVSPLFDELGRAYQRMLADSELERSPAFAERMATLHRACLERPSGTDVNPRLRGLLIEKIRTALKMGQLGPVATSFGQELVATIDLENGLWQGRTVDVAMMDALAESGNEMTLTRFVERLPSAELRDMARRRILRIHIARSPFPEVRDSGAAVEENMIRNGHNRISLKEHPLLNASIQTAVLLPTIRAVARAQAEAQA